MWKWDHVDAYKHIPVAMSDLRLQGFRWLGRYFLEMQEVFGSSYAVSAYDRLSNTLAVVATILADFPKRQVHRILDDLPMVDISALYTQRCAPGWESIWPPYARS
jgi:hypothetical protein